MVSGNLPQTSRIVALVAFGFDHASDDEDVVATEALENCFVQGLRRRFEGKVGVFFGAESEVADVDAAGDSGVDFERAFDGEMGIGDEDRGLVEGAELEGAEFAPNFEAMEEHAVGASGRAGDQALHTGGADVVEEERMTRLSLAQVTRLIAGNVGSGRGKAAQYRRSSRSHQALARTFIFKWSNKLGTQENGGGSFHSRRRIFCQFELSV